MTHQRQRFCARLLNLGTDSVASGPGNPGGLGVQLQSRGLPATIAVVENVSHNDGLALAGDNPFRRGVMVLVTLGNPREKFWGAILALAPEGLSLCGVELASFDDF